MTNDIKVVKNMIGGRQGWAYICNSMKFAVLKADLDAPQEYPNYFEYGNVKVVTKARAGERELAHEGQLVCEDGVYKITSGGCMLSGSFGFEDGMELIENANIPTMREGDIVAIARYSKQTRTALLLLYKVGKIDMFCQTMTRLTELTDDEMAQVAKDADRWCKY